MADPRTSVIGDRLKRIGRIIAVSSGKGGVGKSMVATTLALSLAKRGCKVGLFDLDFTSPSTHIILGRQRCAADRGKRPRATQGPRLGVHVASLLRRRRSRTPARGRHFQRAHRTARGHSLGRPGLPRH